MDTPGLVDHELAGVLVHPHEHVEVIWCPAGEHPLQPAAPTGRTRVEPGSARAARGWSSGESRATWFWISPRQAGQVVRIPLGFHAVHDTPLAHRPSWNHVAVVPVRSAVDVTKGAPLYEPLPPPTANDSASWGCAEATVPPRMRDDNAQGHGPPSGWSPQTQRRRSISLGPLRRHPNLPRPITHVERKLHFPPCSIVRGLRYKHRRQAR
jgi:hypothetical protein